MKTPHFAFSAQGIVSPPTVQITDMFPSVEKPKNKERITNFKLKTGFNIGEFSFDSKEPEHALFGNSEKHRLVFIFNQGDTFEVHHCGRKRTRLTRFQNLLFHCEKQLPISFYFQSNRSFKGTVFSIDADDFQSYIQEETSEAFDYENLYFKSKPELSLTDYISHINAQSKRFPANLKVIGNATIAAGILFTLFLKGDNEYNLIRPSLRSWEIKALKEVTEKIKQNPEQNYTVNQISKETGISIPHLQQGFKEMHGHTVANFIREVRLAKAEDLIKNSDLNISEIVYTIGLSSRSYFSRIFKKKFNCSPSTYQRRQFVKEL